MELLYDPKIQLLVIYMKKKKKNKVKRYVYPNVHDSITIAKIWKQPKISTNR